MKVFLVFATSNSFTLMYNTQLPIIIFHKRVPTNNHNTFTANLMFPTLFCFNKISTVSNSFKTIALTNFYVEMHWLNCDMIYINLPCHSKMSKMKPEIIDQYKLDYQFNNAVNEEPYVYPSYFPNEYN